MDIEVGELDALATGEQDSSQWQTSWLTELHALERVQDIPEKVEH